MEKTAAASNLFKVAPVGFEQPADVFIVSQGRFSRPGLHCAHRHKRAPSPNPNIFITQRQKRCVGRRPWVRACSDSVCSDFVFMFGLM